MRYVGILTRVNRGGTSGFIAAQSVMREFGSRVSKSDIFVHKDNCDRQLFKGARVTFDYDEVWNPKRQKYQLRAKDVTVEAYRPGVEIHFDTTQPISHPEVEARLCYSPLMHRKRIEYLAAGWGFAVALVARHEDQSPNTSQCFVEVFGAEQAFRFVRFSRPGKWTVRALLLTMMPSVNSSNRSQDAIAFLRGALAQGVYLPPLDDMVVYGDPQYALQYPKSRLGWPRNDEEMLRVVAMSEVAVEIPEGIFAKEKPQWLKDYATYFVKAGPSDECRFRQRYLLMVAQTPAWFLIEFAKRAMHGVQSLAQTLDMRQGGLRNLLGTLRPAVRFTPMVPDRTRNDDGGYRGRLGPWRTRYGFAYTPLALVLVTALYRLVTKTVIPAAVEYSSALVNGSLVVLGIVAMAIGYVFLKSKLEDWKKKFKNSRSKAMYEKTEQRIAQEKAFREAVIQAAVERAQAEETLLVCGGEAPQAFSFAPLPEEMVTWKGRLAALKRAITLEPLPEAQRSTTLRFQAVKRVVCAPFQR
jgi:hypothetical protein